MSEEKGLGKQVRPFEETFSAFKVLREHFFGLAGLAPVSGKIDDLLEKLDTISSTGGKDGDGLVTIRAADLAATIRLARHLGELGDV